MPRFKLTNSDNFMTFVKIMDLHPEVKNKALSLLMQSSTKEDIYYDVLRFNVDHNGDGRLA